MMKMYNIYDKVQMLYTNPILCVNDNDAIRSFKKYCSNFENSEDFVLNYICDYDCNTGSMSFGDIMLDPHRIYEEEV